MHREPAAYVLGPLPSRGRDLELEGGVESMHATSSTYTSHETPTCEVPSNGVVEIAYCLFVKLRFRLGPVTQKPLAHCTAR